MQPDGDARVYSLTEITERGNAKNIVKEVSPVSLELASASAGSGRKGIWEN